MGGWGGLQDKVEGSALKEGGLHAWQGLGIGNVTNPIDANWIAIVFGLGFVLSASATGRRTSPRSSARCRPRTCRPRGARR